MILVGMQIISTHAKEILPLRFLQIVSTNLKLHCFIDCYIFLFTNKRPFSKTKNEEDYWSCFSGITLYTLQVSDKLSLWKYYRNCFDKKTGRMFFRSCICNLKAVSDIDSSIDFNAHKFIGNLFVKVTCNVYKRRNGKRIIFY